jgi:hypothetical protein
MSRLRVAPIVEGDGEVACVRILLQRTWEMLDGEFIQIVPPFRGGRGRLVKKDILQKAVRAASLKLNEIPASGDPALILILIDADEDCPGKLGPKLLEYAQEMDSVDDVACVLANVEFETWFAAAAESLSTYLDLTSFSASESPEVARQGKAWVERRFRKTKQRSKYSETRDQPAMTSAMDLALCRRRAASFDKLCRELEQRLRRPPSGA